MTLIDGDRIITAQLYDDEHEEFTEKKMSIIDYVNAYTNEGVTTADDVLDKIRGEIETKYGRCTLVEYFVQYDGICTGRKDIGDIADILQIIDKYKAKEAAGNNEQSEKV